MTSTHKEVRPYRWLVLALLATTPLLGALAITIWRTPYPISETIAVLEDVQRATQSYFDPTARSWYRPLYFLTWDWLWKGTGSLDTALALFKGLEVLAPVSLVLLMLRHLHPRTLLDGATAALAGAVLIGTPGFRANLEVPLLMTLVGMPMALAVWMFLSRSPRWWHGPTIVLLLLAAIGYKEQGLVITPLVVVAWWTRAPGATPLTTGAVVAVTAAYLGFRLWFSANWPIFEQSMGLGFTIIEPADALARFGGFPYPMYAYNALGTILNILVGEPSGGLFAMTRDVAYARVQPWEAIYVVGAVTLTFTILWWAVRVIPGFGRGGWTPESRVAAAFLVSLAACGALSYHYSRDRLGGMAAVFYALAAYEAVRHMVTWGGTGLGDGRLRRRLTVTTVVLAVTAVAWQVRAIGTLEWARRVSDVNAIGWLTALPERRLEFAEREVYLGILNRMIRQGRADETARPTNYPPLLQRTLAAEVPR
jgi:hypothetical protein